MDANNLDMSVDDFHVGQSLWFAHNEKRMHHFNGHVEVSKIGRKWVNLDNGNRFDPETGEVDGKNFSSPGRIYLYKEEWEDQQELGRLWFELRQRIACYSYRPRSIEAVRGAAKALGIDLTHPTPKKDAEK